MNEKNREFSSAAFSELLKSKEAMALAGMLRQMDPQLLSRAASLAGSGQTEQAKQLLQPILEDQKVRQLLKKMEDSNGGIR